MRRSLVSWVFIFTGIFLMMAGMIFGNSVVEKIKDTYGLYSTGKVVVSVTKEAGANLNNLFTSEDADKLSSILENGNLTAEAETIALVKSGNISAKADVRGVNSNYQLFQTVNIIEGSFFTKADEDETNQVAVIDEELALELFKTTRVIGNKIEIFGRNFRIAGIAGKDKSLLGVITEKEENTVYVPVNVLLEVDNETRISSLQIKNEGSDLLERNESTVSEALKAIGKDPSSYIIEDYYIKEVFMQQKTQLAVFIPGIILIITLAGILKKRIKGLVVMISTACRTDYFSNVLRIYKARLFAELTRVLVLTGIIVIVWLGASYKLFIPQKYIPDELIDFSFYYDLLKDSILKGNSMIGYLPPAEEILLNGAQRILDWVFYPALFAGIPLVYIGFYQLNHERKDISVLTVSCSVLTVVAVAAVSVAVIAAGMPLSIRLNGLLVLFTFIYINTIIFSKEREEVF